MSLSARVPPPLPVPRPPAVLVVDDDEATAHLVRRWLERARNASVTTAHDGMSALAMSARTDFDAVFTDIEMIEESGADFARLLRLVRPTLPICLMSGRMRPERALESLGVAVHGFLSKPLQPEIVVGHLDAMLGGTAVFSA